jgi:hypothetical protein
VNLKGCGRKKVWYILNLHGGKVVTSPGQDSWCPVHFLSTGQKHDNLSTLAH